VYLRMEDERRVAPRSFLQSRAWDSFWSVTRHHTVQMSGSPVTSAGITGRTLMVPSPRLEHRLNGVCHILRHLKDDDLRYMNRIAGLIPV
jgi:hypothetical protein